jgi:ankyrin repeat protein
MKFGKSLFFSALFILGIIQFQFVWAQADSSESVIDTSDYITGDIHFNLILAADKGYDQEVLRLLNLGAYINSRTSNGVTPLMYAVENQHTLVVKMLLANGADPNLTDYNGTPAMIPAVIKGNLEICELLIQKGADINIADANGRNALMYAVFYNDYVLTDMLLFYGAEVNRTDNEGNTALNIAAYDGNAEIVKLLSEQAAILEKADNKQFTPLHSASQNGHLDVVDYFLTQGVSLSLKTKAGYTPFALAVENNQYQVTERLIEKGADVNEHVTIATSPLNIAKSNRNDSLIRLLESNGAKYLWQPAFQYYSVNFDLSFSGDDVFIGGGIGFHDTRYGLSLSLGMAARISAKPVITNSIEPNTYYQYWEKRTYLALSAVKRFKLIRLDGKSALGVYAGGQAVYSYGKYRGTKTKPDPRFMLAPFGGAYLQLKSLIITAGYTYMNFKVEKISPHRFTVSMCFLIPGKGMNQPVNKILWAE